MIALSTLLPISLAAVTYSTVSATWLPLVFLAILLDGTIVGLWYVVAYLINNDRMKGMVREEYVQFIGTGIMAILVVSLLVTVNAMLVGSMESTSLMNANAINSMCTNIGAYNSGLLQKLDVLTTNSQLIASTGFSFLGGSSSALTGNFPGLCSYISQQKNSPNSDTQLDYPLAASAVVIANLTNQTAVNLNRLYVLDMYLGYQKNLRPEISLCLQIPNEGQGPCIIPPQASVNPPLLLINASYSPFAGYAMPYKSLGSVSTLMFTSLEIFMAELVTTSMFLYIWPFLLFIGFVLRATMFTRKIGGLFIAIAIGIVLIYPAVFAIEYVALGNGLGPAITGAQGTVGESLGQAYGFNAITANSVTVIDYSNSSNTAKCGTGIPSNCIYTPNFFVEPNIALMAMHDDCWPPLGGSIGALGAVTVDTVKFLIPFYGPLSNVVGFVTELISGAPFHPTSSSVANLLIPGVVPYSCSAPQVEHVAFSMFNAYGIIGMSALLLPIINLIISITAIAGLSGLFGGDTSLAGLAKLV